MEILCPVSVGELLDKISILQIKRARIKDAAKLAHVERELDQLSRAAAARVAGPYERVVAELQKVNEELWDVEDAIRVKERNQQFDSAFIELARSVYRLNDRRFALKNRANQQFGSAIAEQKSYETF
jgi:hypothetical protein